MVAAICTATHNFRRVCFHNSRGDLKNKHPSGQGGLHATTANKQGHHKFGAEARWCDKPCALVGKVAAVVQFNAVFRRDAGLHH